MSNLDKGKEERSTVWREKWPQEERPKFGAQWNKKKEKSLKLDAKCNRGGGNLRARTYPTKLPS